MRRLAPSSHWNQLAWYRPFDRGPKFLLRHLWEFCLHKDCICCGRAWCWVRPRLWLAKILVQPWRSKLCPEIKILKPRSIWITFWHFGKTISPAIRPYRSWVENGKLLAAAWRGGDMSWSPRMVRLSWKNSQGRSPHHQRQQYHHPYQRQCRLWCAPGQLA